MEQFNRLIDKLRLLPIAHIDKVSTPGDINTIEKKVEKFKELILYLNLLSTSTYKLEQPKASDVKEGDETNWFFQQFKTIEKKLNEEILTYNTEGNVMVEIILEFANHSKFSSLIFKLITYCFFTEIVAEGSIGKRQCIDRKYLLFEW